MQRVRKRGFAFFSIVNVRSRPQARSAPQNWTYDELNRVSIAQDPERFQTLYSYDKVGNRIGETWPNGNVLTHAYDALNRPTSSTDVIGSLGARSQDGQGNVLTETDPRGNVTTHVYDTLNRRIETHIPSAAGTRVLKFGHDSRQPTTRSATRGARPTPTTTSWSTPTTA